MSPATPFRITGIIAILVAGVVAAAIAHHPTMPLVWMVAYLVLVAGVVQYALGTAQAALMRQPLAMPVLWGLWLLLNVGQLLVVVASLQGNFMLLLAGTLLYDLAMLWFALTVRNGQSGLLRIGYWILVIVMFISSLTGVVLF